MMLKKFDLARVYRVEFKSRIYTYTFIQHYNIKHLRMYFENIYMGGKSHITVKKISVEKMSINPYGEKLCGVNNSYLVLAHNRLQDFTVVAGTILINPVPQRLLGHLQETFLDLYHVNLYKGTIQNGRINITVINTSKHNLYC